MKFLFLLLIFSIFNLKAAVWNDTRVWTVELEEEFSTWMQSSVVNEVMFTDPKSKYFGINTDCADTSYALRAIFAFEHSLPFAITNPSGSRDANKTLNNRLNKWDKSGDEIKRLKAMIEEIGDSVGTENLAHFDTYPTKISSIKAGTLFMYKIKARLGNFIRHSYNIKAINPVGTFDVIYSTQANKAKHLPLIRRKEREFENLPHIPWGFKKFKWPQLLTAEISTYPLLLGASNEQYDLASNLGEAEFFKMIRKNLAKSSETPGERLNRSFNAVCAEARARIEYVNQGIEHLNSIGSRCMNYEEFDAYSTPARDQALKGLFEKYEESFNDLLKSGELNSANPNILNFSQFIFNKVGNFSKELIETCPINYRSEVTIDLRELRNRIREGKLSSHPNDKIELRWGENGYSSTNCKRWY